MKVRIYARAIVVSLLVALMLAASASAQNPNPSTNRLGEPWVVLNDAASVSVDGCSAAVFSLTLTGNNHTLANPSCLVAGQRYTFIIKQDSAGSRTGFALGTNYIVISGSITNWSTNPNSISVLHCVPDLSLPQTLDCGADGPIASVTFSPTSLTFASRTVGTTSAAQNVSITNVQGYPLPIFAIGIVGANSGDFAASNTCASPIAANGTCTPVAVTFTPTAQGARSASLYFEALNGGPTYTIPLSGTGGPNFCVPCVMAAIGV